MWVGVWFSSRLYYPFGKGPGQHIIRCLKNKKCENEQTCQYSVCLDYVCIKSVRNTKQRINILVCLRQDCSNLGCMSNKDHPTNCVTQRVGHKSDRQRPGTFFWVLRGALGRACGWVSPDARFSPAKIHAQGSTLVSGENKRTIGRPKVNSFNHSLIN